jgi:uncharacterized membrane protein
MKAEIRKRVAQLSDSFWLLPGSMVCASVLLAVALLRVDRSGVLPNWLADSNWLYNGGGTGARTLLGAIASSTIGVAGTVFSITIAALSLAAGQMGPRLLRNFTRDRGNQFTLGAFLGTFSYALMVLRSVRTQDEGLFTPHIALTMGILLAFACVATLVYFVGHMASRINVDTVVELVSDDVRAALPSLIAKSPSSAVPPDSFWRGASVVMDGRRGYLQHLDEDGLANWAAENHTAIRLLIRRGDFVFPGAPVALMASPVPGAEAAIRDATALGDTRGTTGDPEQAIRQLVEVAVRALSPGINDPHTAMSVLDRLGAALCDLAGADLVTGAQSRNGVTVLVVPSVTYARLTDLMLHMIRQNARGSAAVYIRMLHVLACVIACEPDPERRESLARHADLVSADAERTIENSADVADVHAKRMALQRMLEEGPLGAIGVSARAA